MKMINICYYAQNHFSPNRLKFDIQAWKSIFTILGNNPRNNLLLIDLLKFYFHFFFLNICETLSTKLCCWLARDISCLLCVTFFIDLRLSWKANLNWSWGFVWCTDDLIGIAVSYICPPSLSNGFISALYIFNIFRG